MTLKKLKTLIYDDPGLLDARYSLSSSEAAEALRQFSPPSFLELMADAKNNGRITQEELDQCAAAAKESERREKGRERPQLRFRPRYIAAAVLVLLTIFFTLVPQGRVLAQQLFHMVIEFFDGGVVIENQNAREDAVHDFSIEPHITLDAFDEYGADEPINYESIETFKNQYGFSPVVIDGASVALKEILLFDRKDYITLLSIYETAGGCYLSIMQDWGDIPSGIAFAQGVTNSFTEKILGQYDLYCLIDESDQTVSGFTALEASLLEIHAEKIEAFQDILPHIKEYG
ncbi:hypothetical protein LJC27_06695 [Christensenellaceae bacterium OttesenSCG-928-M15]|nr:hypothetical protein [Christensenellaceae bacterium OttesenSCG-928-M15]